MKDKPQEGRGESIRFYVKVLRFNPLGHLPNSLFIYKSLKIKGFIIYRSKAILYGEYFRIEINT